MENKVKFELDEKIEANFNQQKISVTPLNTPIDFYKLKPEMFEKNTSVTQHNLNVPEKLERSMFNFIDLEEKETVVLNIPVGKGKSTLFYGLVEEYVKLGFIVLMASPYKKLVLKDTSKLHERGIKAFNYLDLKSMKSNSEEFKAALNCDVHVMTINCLLQNPGESNFMQADIKNKYLQGIRNRATTEGKGVVLFLDELHEGVFNFKNEFIPSLKEWKELIHKCLVGSATFNTGAVKVVQLIGDLTQNKIKLVECPVTKNSKQAHLHLHIVRETYGKGKIKPLEFISTIIQESKGKKVNILSGSKTLIDSLTDETKVNNYTKKLNDPIVESIYSLNPQVTTSTEEEVSFDINKNNIGTTFKTGVDISEPDSVFIILLPCIVKRSDLLQSEGNYGIFTDGIPSLIQAVGRLREGGEIHVFMYSPPELIQDNLVMQLLPVELHAKPITHLTQNGVDELVKKSLATKLNRTKTGQEVLKSENLLFSIDVNEIENALSEIRLKDVSFGKYLSPYMLWASLNDQFSNATLKSIFIHKENQKVVQIKNEKRPEVDLMTHLNLSNLEEWKKCSLWECYFKVKSALEFSTEIDSKTGKQVVSKLSFMLNGKSFSGVRFKKAVLTTSELIRTNLFDEKLTYDEYIRRVLVEEVCKNPDYRTTLHMTYFQFNELGIEFKNFITKNILPPAKFETATAEVSEGDKVVTIEAKVPTVLGYLLDKIQDDLEDEFVIKAHKKIRELLTQDSILKDVFDIYQKAPVQVPTDTKELIKLKSSLFRIFEEVFLVLGKRTKIGGSNGYPVFELRHFSLFTQEDINALESKI